MLTAPELVLIACVALGTAAMVLWLMRPIQAITKDDAIVAHDPISLLFDGGVLHHATQRALNTFAFLPGTHVWEDLRTALLPQFPEFPEQAGQLGTGNMILVPADPDDPSVLEVNWRDGLCWVQLTQGSTEAASSGGLLSEHRAHARCIATMAQPAWETDAKGRVGWRNAAYETLAKAQGIAEGFPVFELSAPFTPSRQRLFALDGQAEWYDVTSHPGAARTMHHAVRITPLVESEDTQRAFVQTLAKTFADLPVGLAIFDRAGQLSIFNPALVDLTGLQAQFLATQPTMLSFFDQLRENRRMPEPKNYRSWREEIADVISAASDGLYQETWNLEDGRTYAVQGRPHPDGATAFLIEDISSEVILTRNYRIEVSQYEALLDQIDDPLVVFSATGILTFCNAAYRDLWGHNPESAFADVTISDAIALWQARTSGMIDWDDVSDFVTTFGPRQDKPIELPMKDGSSLTGVLSPIAADATLLRCRVAARPPSSTALKPLQKTG